MPPSHISPILLEMTTRPFLLRLIESQHCQLVGNFFGYAIQAGLGICAFSSLIIKKVTDTEKRTWLHWSRDTSKQALASLIVHISNLLISYFLSDDEFSDPCVFYMITFVVDAILGTIWSIVWVKGIEWLDAKYWQTGYLQSGFYGRPPSCKTWGIQTGVFILITAVGKCVLLWGIVKPFESQLYAAGIWVMSPFLNTPKVELVMVMVVIPVVLNAVVFWQTDRWIMNSSHNPDVYLPPDMDDEFPCCVQKLTSEEPQPGDRPLPHAPGSPTATAPAHGHGRRRSVDESTQTMGDATIAGVAQQGEGIPTMADASTSTGGGGNGVVSVSSGTSSTVSAPLVGGNAASGNRRKVLLSSSSSRMSSSNRHGHSRSSTGVMGRMAPVAPAQRLRAQDYHRL